VREYRGSGQDDIDGIPGVVKDLDESHQDRGVPLDWEVPLRTYMYCIYCTGQDVGVQQATNGNLFAQQRGGGAVVSCGEGGGGWLSGCPPEEPRLSLEVVAEQYR